MPCLVAPSATVGTASSAARARRRVSLADMRQP
jgi:hypothetical protein